MTSKERVLTALSLQCPDRVPVNYQANPGIHRRLLEHFHIPPDKPETHDKLCQALGVDFRGIGTWYRGPKMHADIPERGVTTDHWGIHWCTIQHPSGSYRECCDFPLMDADEETVARWPLPDPAQFDYSIIASQVEQYQSYATRFVCYGDWINVNGQLRGMEQTLMDLATDEPAGLLLAERRFTIQAEMIRRTLEAGQGKIDVVLLGEDLGMQDRPMISLESFRKHIRPQHQKQIDICKHYGAKVMMHSCGSSSWAFEDFIQMGVDVVDALQPEAANMSPQYLKQTFGGRLAFHGCISTAGPVAFGSPEDVERDCQEKLTIMMPGGGYCFAPTHALQDNSPTENVVAMYRAAQKYGCY